MNLPGEWTDEATGRQTLEDFSNRQARKPRLSASTRVGACGTPGCVNHIERAGRRKKSRLGPIRAKRCSRLDATGGADHGSAAREPAKEVALTERTLACRPLVHLIQFFKLFSLGEREDAGCFLDTKIRRDDCIAFEAGDKVNLTKQESNGLFVCLRRIRRRNSRIPLQINR